MSSVAPLNSNTPLTQDERGKAMGFVTTYFRTWLLGLTDLLTKSVAVLNRISLLAQAASLASTSLLRTTTAGFYRIQVYVRITQAASTSSSLTVTLGWLESGLVVTHTFDAVIGNTTATVQATTFCVPADAQSDLTISAVYASVGATPMQFRLDATAELVAQ